MMTFLKLAARAALVTFGLALAGCATPPTAAERDAQGFSLASLIPTPVWETGTAQSFQQSRHFEGRVLDANIDNADTKVWRINAGRYRTPTQAQLSDQLAEAKLLRQEGRACYAGESILVLHHDGGLDYNTYVTVCADGDTGYITRVLVGEVRDNGAHVDFANYYGGYTDDPYRRRFVVTAWGTAAFVNLPPAYDRWARLRLALRNRQPEACTIPAVIMRAERVGTRPGVKWQFCAVG